MKAMKEDQSSQSCAAPERNPSVNWSVYLIRTTTGQLYCGVTTDVARRFSEHQGTRKGAKFLRGKGPLTLAWAAAVGEKRTAMRLEYQIKRLTKAQKESIVAQTLAWQDVMK